MLGATHQGAEDALALGDGGHLLQGKLSKTQLTGHQRVQGQIPGGSVPSCGHDACRRAEKQRMATIRESPHTFNILIQPAQSFTQLTAVNLKCLLLLQSR